MANFIDDAEQVLDDIKWFMFNQENTTICNEFGYSPNVEFGHWIYDTAFTVLRDGVEYKISIEKV